ncbi:MAG: phosphodiesterase, partial [Rhodospirillales bacterium]
TGIGFMDKQPLKGRRKLEKIVRRRSSIVHVICGHIHRPVQAEWAATSASAAPSVAFQMALGLEIKASSAITTEPPACAVFLWSAKDGFIGHHISIG